MKIICGLLAGCVLILLARAAAPAPTGTNYPLALHTKWTDHLHQEVGEGVHFGEALTKLAKGNSVDFVVISEVVGSDVINGQKYVRVESRRSGEPWLTAWYLQTADGLLLISAPTQAADIELSFEQPLRVHLFELVSTIGWVLIIGSLLSAFIKTRRSPRYVRASQTVYP